MIGSGGSYRSHALCWPSSWWRVSYMRTAERVLSSRQTLYIRNFRILLSQMTCVDFFAVIYGTFVQQPFLKGPVVISQLLPAREHFRTHFVDSVSLRQMTALLVADRGHVGYLINCCIREFLLSTLRRRSIYCWPTTNCSWMRVTVELCSNCNWTPFILRSVLSSRRSSARSDQLLWRHFALTTEYFFTEWAV